MRRRLIMLGLVAVCCLPACTPNGTDSSSPSPAVSSLTPDPSTTPSATPTRTPSERDRAVEGATKAFADFLRQTDLVSQQGGAERLPAALRRLTTGPQTQQSLRDARDIKSGNFRSSGFGRFVYPKAKTVQDLSRDVSTVVLTGCIDQSAVSVTKGAKRYTKNPGYVHVTEARIERRSGIWRVYIWGGDIVPRGFTCENYS